MRRLQRGTYCRGVRHRGLPMKHKLRDWRSQRQIASTPLDYLTFALQLDLVERLLRYLKLESTSSGRILTALPRRPKRCWPSQHPLPSCLCSALRSGAADKSFFHLVEVAWKRPPPMSLVPLWYTPKLTGRPLPKKWDHSPIVAHIAGR